MNIRIILATMVGVIYVVVLLSLASQIRPEQQISTMTNPETVSSITSKAPTPTPPLLIDPPPSAQIPIHTHVYQTFNNCGPATLSMYLAHLGINVSQQQLGAELRPYQNPQGDNDDKSVTLEELAKKAESLGFEPYHLPNGDPQRVRLFIANGIPLITRTWLHAGEDVGHYRVLHGYDTASNTFLQSDSYEGPNRTFAVDDFMNLWRDFNYEYLVIVPSEQTGIVEAILGDEVRSDVVWGNALERAQAEGVLFNQVVAYYHLGNYEESVRVFEQIKNQLPGRMLWYQIEPIQAYAQLNNSARVFELTDVLLSGGNRAFSELYSIRSDMLIERGMHEAAAIERARADFYMRPQ